MQYELHIIYSCKQSLKLFELGIVAQRQWYTHGQLMTSLGINGVVHLREVLHKQEENPKQALWLDISPLLFLCVHEP